MSTAPRAAHLAIGSRYKAALSAARPMKLPPYQIALAIVAAASAILGLVALERTIAPARLGLFRAGIFAVTALAIGVALQVLAPSHEIGVDIAKGIVAALAAGGVFYEAHRAAIRRPLSERWKRFAGASLGALALLCYFNGLRSSYPHYYHTWDQYHYYMGAKYFPELGYDGLYRCGVVAQDELGNHTYTDEDTGARVTIDMSREVRHPDKKIRDLGGDNLLKPAGDVLAHPERCKSLFSPARWDEYKRDVAFFRTAADKGLWEMMQKDHGFNPPPVWCIAGKLLADLHPATTGYLQFLASLDVLYLLGMLAALWWSFGSRVACGAAIFWGCQSPAPYLWTGGAFLRQDWLFFTVLSVCLLHRKYYFWAAAALVHAALLRVFPGLLAIGWLGVAAFQLLRRRRLTRPQLRMLAGGALAACVLVPVSLQICGRDSYRQFYEHTLRVHDSTPLTNHMGLRVLLGQKVPFEIDTLEIGSFKLPVKLGTGRESGRMKYTEDRTQADPWAIWKEMRDERYRELKPLAYAIILLTLGALLAVLRRRKSMWVALCLAQVLCIVMAQLTCYYYSFLILSAPLTRVRPARRLIELLLFGFVIVSQIAFRAFHWNDDRYWMLTLLCLLLCYALLLALAPRALLQTICRRPPFFRREGAGPKGTGANVAT